MLRGEVVRDRALRGYGGDGVLEHEVVRAVDFDNHREAIEVLDACIELPAVDEVDADRHLLATGVVEKHVLDVRLCGRRRSWFSDLGHQLASPRGRTSRAASV